MLGLENVDFGAIASSVTSKALCLVNTLLPLMTKCVPYILPLILAYCAYQLGKNLYTFVMSQQVVGESNEWVVIIRDGKMVTAGVGLNCFKWPLDTVAKFPSSVKEVEFTAEQVTTEMQGLNVAATLAWTIYREGDGPFRAYKTHGSDLCNQRPTHSNNKLVAMAQSIVREVIANNTIDDVIKNRDLIIDKIKGDLAPTLKGWGMWLERVDIKDVKICSRRLFEDVQAKFRVEQRKDAEIKSIQATNTLQKERLKRELDTVTRTVQQDKQRARNEIQRETDRIKRDKEAYKGEVAVSKRAKDRQISREIFDMEQDHQSSLKQMKLNFELWKQGQIQEIKEKEARQQNVIGNGKIDLANLQAEHQISKKDDEAARERKKARYNLTKQIFSDEKLRNMEYLRAQKEIYGRYCSTVNIHQMDGQDPYVTQLDSFVNSALKDKDYDNN